MGRRTKRFLAEGISFTGIADKGRSVGRDHEGRVFFVEGVVPGDVADVQVLRKKKGYFLGRLERLVQPSPDRREPFCRHFEHCGGCKWQHLSYEAQLRHKQQVVEDALRRIGKVEVEAFQPILGAEATGHYRNKLEFTFSNRRWLAPEDLNTEVPNEAEVLGFHPPGAFDKVIDIQECWLQPEPSNRLRNGIRAIALEQELPFYDIREHRGFLRTLMFRITTLGEVLVIVAFGGDAQAEPDKREAFLSAIVQRFPEITTLIYCINPKQNDFMMDLEMHTFSGKGYVEERLGDVLFRIGPKSFFQTNTAQARRLYDQVLEFAQLQGDENVYDLYTGLGSIALYLAGHCGRVVGIEEIAAAIDDARENARLNGVDNAVFYAGDVKDILTPEFAAVHGKPDLLITDPPRAGMHPKVVELLLELDAPRMVYVSCNPATQARDIQLLSHRYRVVRSRPVDMFPHTHHIENIVLLERKNV